VTAAFSLHGIAKRFGDTTALAGVDLVVRAGAIHALLGENGAGKSTLMRIVAGLTRADTGTLTVDGAPYAARDPRDARAHGIAMVHQHFTSVDALTVWENVTLGAGWPLAGARARVASLIAARGIALDVDAPAGSLSVGLRQQLELQKALATEPRILLLDEPTGVLTPPEVAELFATAKAFAAGGGTVVLITHKLDEALQHAEGITVLRHGRVTGHWSPGDARPTKETLLAAMLGAGRPTAGPTWARVPPGRAVATQGPLTLYAGEVVGVAGVEGNGQRELLRSFGAEAFIPEDRTTEGSIAEFSLTENLALREAAGRSGAGIDWTALRAQMTGLIDRYRIVTPGPEAPIGELSGGNQQKVIVARALEGRPGLIVAENPARGLDVGAAEETFLRLREAAAAGAAVLFYSTDLDEVITWADRVVVMNRGVLLTPPPAADRDAIGALMVHREGSA
jgi:ABC-type uncharacterized transport system ATPase subunit